MAEWLGFKRHNKSSAELSSAASSEFEEVGLEELGGLEAVSTDRTSRPAQATSTHSSFENLPSMTTSHSKAPGQQQDPVEADATAFDPFKDLESATQKAAEMAREAAKEVSSKLFGGTADARASLTRLAGDVSSWWANLDPTPQPGHQSNANAAANAACHLTSQVTAEIQQHFGLPATEELVEQLPCTLVQAAQCTHNTFTPHVPVRFRGVLYITSQHACFSAPAEQLTFSVKLNRSSEAAKTNAPMKRVSTASRSTGETPALRLTLGGSDYVMFEDFDGAGLDSALGLIEHLAAESGGEG